MSLVGIYHLRKRWVISATWVYGTGNAITLPQSEFMAGLHTPGRAGVGSLTNMLNNASPATDYGSKNASRMAPYHRADIGITWNLSPNNKKGRKHALVLSVYNLYNRRNAFSIYFRNNPDYPVNTEAVRYSVIATIVPAITYNFKF